MSDFKAKCTKFDFRWGSGPDHTLGAYSAPLDPPSRSLFLRAGRERKGKGRGGREREGSGPKYLGLELPLTGEMKISSCG